MTGLLTALTFLTTLPIPLRRMDKPDSLGRAAPWFSLVGALLGGLLWLAFAGLGWLFPQTIVAALVTALWALITGGLHLDGLADCCDGLLAAAVPERRLEIMRDPRLGTFGGVGLALFLLLKFLAVLSLPPDLRLAGLVLAPALARWLLLPAALQPQARPGGLGAAFAGQLSRWGLLVGALTPAALATLFGLHAWLAAAMGCLAALAAVALARRRLGGVTGDVFGLVVELSELAVLLGFSMHLPGLF